MNIMLQRKNILKIEHYYNVISNYRMFTRDNENSDLEMACLLLNRDTTGYVVLEKKKISFGLTIINYFFKEDETNNQFFLFSKKKVIFFKKGIMNAKSIYYKELCTYSQ